MNRLTKIRHVSWGNPVGSIPGQPTSKMGMLDGHDFCVSKQPFPGSYPRDSDMMVSDNPSQRQEMLEF